MAESRLIHDTITGRIDHVDAPVRWLYDSGDPYAVTVDLAGHWRAAGADGPAPIWTFGRSVLIAGLHGAPAEAEEFADVRFALTGHWLTMRLSSPDGCVHVRFVADPVRRFATRTQRLVGVGRESRHLDVDSAIAQLLGGVS